MNHHIKYFKVMNKLSIILLMTLLVFSFQNCGSFDAENSINFSSQSDVSATEPLNERDNSKENSSPSPGLSENETNENTPSGSNPIVDESENSSGSSSENDKPDEMVNEQQNESSKYKYGNGRAYQNINDPSKSKSPLSVYQSVYNSDFNTKTTRISRENRHHYSKRQAFNSDETLINLRGQIYSAQNYSLVSSHQSAIQNIERNWSNLSPHIIYGLSSDQKSFVMYNLNTNSNEELISFTGYSKCSLGSGEGNISTDDRYAFIDCNKNGKKYGLSIDLKEKRILGTIELDKAYNWGSFSQSGKYIIIQGFEISNRAFLYDKSLNLIRKVTDKLYHGDFGYNDKGEEVYAAISWDYIHYFRLSDNQLVFTAKGVGHGHLSCRNILRPGWCYYSSFGGALGAAKLSSNSSTKSVSGSPPGQKGIVGLNLVEPMGFHRSGGSSYDAQAKLSVSPSGTKAIFNSNWYEKDKVGAYVSEFLQGQ